MGKKKSSKSNEAIREYLTQNPGATAGVAIPALKEQGVKATDKQINNIRYELKKKGLLASGGTRKPRKTTTTAVKKTSTPAPRGSKLMPSTSELFEAKKLIDALGGIEEARRALATLEKLHK